MSYHYSTLIKEGDAKAVGLDLPISTKHSIEICNHIRGKSLTQAKKILDEAVNLQKAIPFKRFNGDVGHRKGHIGAGRYVPKACGTIKHILESAQANAVFQGLSANDLVIRHISAQKAANQQHFGRARRRLMKRTHIEVVLSQAAEKKKSKGEAKKTISSKQKSSSNEKPSTVQTKPKVEEKKAEEKETLRRETQQPSKTTSKQEEPSKQSVVQPSGENQK